MKNILKKIHAVMGEIKYIKKDKKNPHHGYTYASELAIKEALHAQFCAQGIVFQLQTGDPKVVVLGRDKYDKDITQTELTCAYTFWDIESGEKLEGKFVASGPARDDKGLWAATTNAIKYILTSTFLIPTGDDAESDKNHPKEEAGKKPAGKKPAAKKTTKKDEPGKKPPAKVEGGDPPLKEQFGIRFMEICEAQNVPIPDPKTRAELLKCLCEMPSTEQIDGMSQENEIWEKPTPKMKIDSTGWKVLMYLISIKDYHMGNMVRQAKGNLK